MRTQFGKVHRESDVCVLCTYRKATSKEHIPPQSIFVDNPEAYLLVPACDICNQGSKLEDDYLAQVMSAASWTPEAQEVWTKKFRPRVQRRPATREGLLEGMTEGQIEIPGVVSGPWPVFMADARRIKRVIWKMVCGLYWFHTTTMLAPDTPFKATMRNFIDLNAMLKDPRERRQYDQTTLGIYRDEDVTRRFFYTAAFSLRNSLWYFFFYQGNAMIAATGEGLTGNEPDPSHVDPARPADADSAGC